MLPYSSAAYLEKPNLNGFVLEAKPFPVTALARFRSSLQTPPTAVSVVVTPARTPSLYENQARVRCGNG